MSHDVRLEYDDVDGRPPEFAAPDDAPPGVMISVDGAETSPHR